MLTIIVDKNEYKIDSKMFNAMQYIVEADAIEKGHLITITNISQKTFEFILEILKTLDYDIKQPPKIKSNVVEDHIGKQLAGFIGKLDAQELNSLYRAVHYLKIYPLRKCIAAVMACRVYIEPTLQKYNAKKKEIGLKEELTTEKTREYKDRFPFFN